MLRDHLVLYCLDRDRVHILFVAQEPLANALGDHSRDSCCNSVHCQNVVGWHWGRTCHKWSYLSIISSPWSSTCPSIDTWYTETRSNRVTFLRKSTKEWSIYTRAGITDDAQDVCCMCTLHKQHHGCWSHSHACTFEGFSLSPLWLFLHLILLCQFSLP